MTDRQMTLVGHLDELRRRILISLAATVIGTCIAFWKIKPIVAYLARPVGNLVFLSPTEAFMAYFKLAFFAGLFLASPVILFQIWSFISVALTGKERRIFLSFMPFSVALFLCGAAFAFFIVVPLALKFLINFAGPEVLPVISISEYLSFIVALIIMFGAVFELPVGIIILSKLGLVTPATLKRNRKWAILIIFIAAAVLTPTPDAFTQVLMAVPLILLYEVSIWVSRLANVKKEKTDDT
jgi:sec-independent protein translocase protein TatC